MMTFDGWDARFCGDAMALPGDYLMHFRTKGSKNGVRRYQQEDGTWTPLGLKLRKEREGWGETRNERRAEKKVARAEKKAASTARRIERKEQRQANRKQRMTLDNISDDELRRKIERAKMVNEYKELTKNPALKTAEKAVTGILNYMDKRSDRKWEREKMELERDRMSVDRARIEADKVRSKEQTKQAAERVKEAQANVEKMKQDRKAGLKISRKADFKRAKKENRESTFVGAFIKTHKEAKLARIETRKEVRKGMAFVKSTIKSANANRRHNAFRKKKNRLRFVYEQYEGQNKERAAAAKSKSALDIAKQVAKQKEAEARKAQDDKDKAYWEWKTSGRKPPKGGKS